MEYEVHFVGGDKMIIDDWMLKAITKEDRATWQNFCRKTG